MLRIWNHKTGWDSDFPHDAYVDALISPAVGGVKDFWEWIDPLEQEAGHDMMNAIQSIEGTVNEIVLTFKHHGVVKKYSTKLQPMVLKDELWFPKEDE